MTYITLDDVNQGRERLTPCVPDLRTMEDCDDIYEVASIIDRALLYSIQKRLFCFPGSHVLQLLVVKYQNLQGRRERI